MTNQLTTISRRTLFQGTGALVAAATLGASNRAVAEETIAGRDLMMDKRPLIHPDGPKLGVYDPYGDFSTESRVATEHLFLPWEDVDLSVLPAADEYALQRGRKVLVTIEPWSWDLDWNVSTDALRQAILSGKHDVNMRAICEALAGFKSPVTIRWAQEMENPSGRFTWSLWRPADYIEAYKRMYAIAREILPNTPMMWSPKGLETAKDYYPGDEFVDLVGLSVFGYDEFEKIEYGKPRDFAEDLKLGYDTTVGFGKPIWIAELGYEGNLEYLTRWVQDVTRNFAEYPELKEVVYFNDKEVWPWPHGLGLPDWRVVRQQINYPVRPERN
ncbi:MAG: glycosyl hydrolase family 5 [Notoacmeibacter sp.]|nr:glycosyl hydrolase family 5 [Notoacmeibacter sp.]